jgi:hypothetical protein
MSSVYPSFHSHHYEKCDGDDDELDFDIEMFTTRL